jgi:hypothetical protein
MNSVAGSAVFGGGFLELVGDDLDAGFGTILDDEDEAAFVRIDRPVGGVDRFGGQLDQRRRGKVLPDWN